jgi:hypothetical protein
MEDITSFSDILIKLCFLTDFYNFYFPKVF